MTVEKELKRIAKLDRYVRPEKVTGAIKLDSNENFALDREFVSKLAIEAASRVDLREYPIDELDGLYVQLARYTGINERYIGAGNGSDQIIELLLTTIAGTRDNKSNKNSRSSTNRATVFVPTFSYFINRCELHGIRVDRVSLDKNFELDVDRFVRSAQNSSLIYLCSPNNPTGGQLPRKVAVELLDRIDDRKSLVLVDEAYVDFADYSLAKEATRRGNVIVLRTLSKAFGLAGARVGYMISSRETTDVFRSTIQSPYPMSTLSLIIATAILERADFVKETVEGIRSERRRIYDRLASLNGIIRVFRSDANFLFIETGRSYSAIAKKLESKGIMVKLLGDVSAHRGCMRVTIGTQEMNDRFLKCIEEVAAATTATTTDKAKTKANAG
jgi:histidinol-phosphate aminotransferase